MFCEFDLLPSVTATSFKCSSSHDHEVALRHSDEQLTCSQQEESPCD